MTSILLLGSTVIAQELRSKRGPSDRPGRPQQRPTQKPEAKSSTSSGITAGMGSKATAHSYNQFCTEGAQDMMASLDRANKERFEQIAEYKKQLQDLTKYNAMLAQAAGIRKRYLESVGELSAPRNKERAAEVTSKLDNIKSVLRNGLTLSAVSLLIEKQDESKSDMPTVLNMESLCKGNTTHVLCKKDEKSHIKPFFGAESHKLDETLKNFQSMSTLPPAQQKSLKEEVKKIVAAIPKDISPDSILETVSTAAPTLTKLLSNPVSRENLILCLSEKTDEASRQACSNVLANPEDRENLITAFNRETKELTSKLAPAGDVVNLALANTQTDLAKAVSSFDSSSKTSVDNMKGMIVDSRKLMHTASTLMASKNKSDQLELRLTQEMRGRGIASVNPTVDVQEQLIEREKELTDQEFLFYKRPSSNQPDVLAIQKRAMDLAKTNADYFEKNCDFSGTKTPNENERVKKCAEVLGKATNNLDAFQKDHLEQMALLKSKVNDLTSDKDFTVNENLKEYLALKYICNCQKDKKISMNMADNSLTLATPTCSEQFLTVSRIQGLSDQAGAIAHTLYANEIVPLDDTKSCSFSTAKLKTFTDSCSKVNSQDGYSQKICENIKAEYTVKVEKKNEEEKVSKKWDDLHAKNHVTYDPRTGGYTAIPKKSALRIFGEGVLPVAPSLIPMWLGNWQTKNYISTMTDMAIDQKQYLYNIDVYSKSPWMYDFNYFLNNPFANFGNAGLNINTNNPGFSF